MIRRELCRRLASARFDGRARSQAFDAIAMERTHAREAVARPARHADVPELGVVHAEYRPAAHDAADADTRAYGHVGKVSQALRRAPSSFGQCRTIDVGIEVHGDAEAPAEPLRDVGVAPGQLAGRGDESVRGGIRAQVDRAKRRNAQRPRRPVLLAPALQHGLDLPQRLLAFAGGQALHGAHVIRAAAEDAHALGAAQLDTRQ